MKFLSYINIIANKRYDLYYSYNMRYHAIISLAIFDIPFIGQYYINIVFWGYVINNINLDIVFCFASNSALDFKIQIYSIKIEFKMEL